jgi:hypothetical protein
MAGWNPREAFARSVGRTRRYAEVNRERLVFVAFGFVFAFIPTAFAISPAWGGWPWEVRALILATWAFVGGFVVFDAVRQAEQLGLLFQTLTPEERRERTLEREPALALAAQTLLDHPLDFPEGQSLNLYLLDEPAWTLVCYAASEGTDKGQRWEVGRGATGAAFATRKFVRAVGPAVYNDQFRLTPKEQDIYRQSGVQVVASMPVSGVRAPIGVLTAFSKDPAFLESDAGKEAMEVLASTLGSVLYGLSEWRPTDPEATVSTEEEEES